MSKFLKNSFLAFSLLASCFQLSNAYLSKEEQQEILATSSAPQEIKERLDAFFADTQVQDVFVNRKRPYNLGWFAQKLTNRAQRIYATDAQKLQLIFQQYYSPKIHQICQKFGIKRFNGSTTKLFIIYDLIPGFIVKIPSGTFPSLPKVYDYFPGYTESCTTPYQNISRVFYNEKLKKLIASEQLTHIKELKKYLYHIPGGSEDLCDDNYIVISEEVKPLIQNPQGKMQFFKQVLSANGIVEEHEELITEFIQAITGAGLWDINASNIEIVLDKDEILKIVFIDTEKPGFGGSEDRHFFQHNHGEFVANSRAGMDGLCELLKH